MCPKIIFMLKIQHLLFTLLLPMLLQAQAPLHYTISPVEVSGKRCLQVQVSFTGNARGVSYLAYQDNQFGQPEQMNALIIPAQKVGITLQKEPDSNRLTVQYPPSAGTVEVIYQVRDLQGDSTSFYEYCCNNPIILPEYFHVQSSQLLAVPNDYWASASDQKMVELAWKGFPENWLLHNSFGPDAAQKVRLTNGQFGSAIFVGGDFRRTKFEVKGQPVYFVTRGRWKRFSDSSLDSLLQKTVQGLREFWNDYSDSIYTVTFLPVEDTSAAFRYASSTGGSGLTNSFMSYTTNNDYGQFHTIRYVYVHELMHRWIGTRIENAQEERQYWFSEGFTEYYTLKNSLRYGFIDVNQFFDELNQEFNIAHYKSSKRTMPNDSMNYRNFWSGDKEWEKLPYQRGCLYAFYLDNLIREKSKGKKSLDEFMREILAEVDSHPGQKLDHAFFLSLLKTYTGKHTRKTFKKYIEQGELIDFSQTILPAGVQVIVKDITLKSGPSPDIITKTETIKNVPIFKPVPGADPGLLKAALLR